ncbi:MAG TPA: hypothetical protein DCQ06_03975, partial [Myxococcales bacterium]|nr:hypothetical protein [Myxococcales bacterium]
DENYTYNTLALGKTCDGIGVCAKGLVECSKVSKVAICSTDPGGSNPGATPEICDNLDNDCDGKTDDGMLYNGLPRGSVCNGIGACGLGTVECNLTTNKAVCSSNPDGTNSNSIGEQCDGKDNDCDGATDESIDVATNTCNKLGVCATVLKATCKQGVWACVYEGSVYQKVETWCDNLDNDCNGVTDDKFVDKGKSCDGPDPDKCANGKLICAPDKASVMCSKEDPLSTIELCDGKDNDCDGKTDEGFDKIGQPCDGPDSDKCINGKWACSQDGKTQVCDNEFPANIKEICDGKDNDCDGKTDEGFDVGAACDGPDADKCKFGKIQCTKSGQAVCSTETKVNQKEICNDLDDDCDGVTDEGFFAKGQKCDSAADVDACKTGTFICKSGAMVCFGDYECAVGTTCQSTSGPKNPEYCACGSGVCSADLGDTCAGGKCTCNGGAVCGPTQMCIAGTGCKTP